MHRPGRTGFVALALACSACPPGAETDIPCAQQGDLACPTGFHCGDKGLCQEGEAPPRIVIVKPVQGATLAGRTVEIVAEAACPTGIGDAASISVVAAEKTLPGVVVRKWKNEPLEATYETTIDASSVSGEATVVVSVPSRDAEVGTGSARATIHVP